MSRLLTLVLVALFLLAAPVSAQQSLDPTTLEFLTRTDPVSLIGAYYNAISRGEYDRAYSYWEQAPNNQTAAQFAAGFADTLTVRAAVYLPVYTDAGAGNIHASLPTLVTAQRRDGTQAYFVGCFIAHKTNVPVGNATEPDPNWFLQQGSLSQLEVPDLSLLDTACQQTENLTAPVTFAPGQLDPVQLITSYFNQATTFGIQQVASYWQNPYGDVFAALYGQSSGGQTNFRLYVNPEIFAQGAAGSIYASIPALLATTGADGLRRYIGGCYTARLSNVPVGNATAPDPNWYFTNVNLTLTADMGTAVNTLAQGCAV